MKIAIDFDTIVHNLKDRSDIGTGVIDHDIIEKLKEIKDENELVLRVCLLDFSFSDFMDFLHNEGIYGWFEGIEVVTNEAQYLVSNRSITGEQFKQIATWNISKDKFEECIVHSQSQEFTVI